MTSRDDRGGESPGAGRFAPSPTSDLHLGNLRTALLAWLAARAEGLRFVVRCEDLDQARVAAAPGVASRQLADLEALGIDWDGPVLRQSERLEIYRQMAAELDHYECFCTRREIAEASQAPHQSYRPYPGTCLHLSPEQRELKRRTRPAAIRVRAHDASFTISDRFAGRISGVVDDFVLVRNDGTPAYNLAVVVDDGLQGITQVTRGNDLLDSAPRQAWLADQLGFPVPDYVHLGLAVNPAGTRLAKRDGAVTLSALRHQGFTTQHVLWMITDSCDLPRADSAHDLLAMVRHNASLSSPRLAEPWVITPQVTTPAR